MMDEPLVTFLYCFYFPYHFLLSRDLYARLPPQRPPRYPSGEIVVWGWEEDNYYGSEVLSLSCWWVLVFHRENRTKTYLAKIVILTS